MNDIRIREADGQAPGLSDMADWLLTVLSGGDVRAYAKSVLDRASLKDGSDSANVR